MHTIIAAAVALAAVVSTPAQAQGPRELLAQAAFVDRDRATALARVESARKAAEATLARDPSNREAQLQRALAIGYRAQLKRSLADAKASRRAFEALVAANPRDPEAQLALGGWHLLAIVELRPLLARTALGARKEPGMQAINRALATGGSRALFPGYASMTLIQLNPNDVARARQLAEAAAKAQTPTTADRFIKTRAEQLLVPLRAGNGKAAAALAEKLMPFGRLR